MSGTVNISRDIWHDEAFADEPFTEREAFVWLIMEASWKPRKKRLGNVIVELKRGQLAASTRFMAAAWGWSKSRVNRYLGRLKKRDSIGTDTRAGVLVITICKYERYQNAPHGSKATAKTSAGQQRDSSGTNENKDAIRDIKRDTNVSPKNTQERGSRLPKDWALPQQWGEWALREGYPEAMIRREAMKFRDYWIGVPGQKGRKLDWLATWRNWMRKAEEGNPNGKRNSSNPQDDPTLQLIAEVARSV